MAAKPANKNAAGKEVEILFPMTAQESFAFNRFEVTADDTFVFIKLAWADESAIFPVFYGAISLIDARETIGSFKSYVERIGGPEAGVEFPLDTVIRFRNPLYFNHIGMALHGPVGEVIFGHFSHKAAADVSQAASGVRTIAASMKGAYTSPAGVHRKLLWEYIKVVSPK